MALNPYEILGISKTATQEEIKNAYRRLAKQYHPDLNPGNKAAEKKFKEVNQANELLGNAETRSKYDRGELNESGQANFTEDPRTTGNKNRGPFYYETQNQGGRYSFSFDDLNDDFLSSILGSARRRSQASPGSDVNYKMEISLKDAFQGKETEVTLPSGKRFLVKIPAGIVSGTKLRFRGQGGSPIGQAPAGDLYIEVSVRPSHLFRRVGQDVEMDLPISIHEAILGAEIQVPTLGGPVILKIPPGVNTDSKLRIRNKGFPMHGSKQRGDQIAVLKLMLPKKVDSELRSAIQEWSKNQTYDPRESLNVDTE